MNYVFTITDKYLEKLKTYYQKILVKSDNPNHKYLFKSDEVTITVFNSLKVMFQGEQALEEYNKWAHILGFEEKIPEEKILGYDNQYSNLKVIGSDEVGTGDFFGPVVVSSAYVGPNDYPFLENLDIKDSKKLSDKAILEIGESLIKNISHTILITNNEKYNELIEKGFNMNKIKAYLHNHSIKKLVVKHPDYQMVILDKFTSKESYFKYLETEDTFKNINFLTQAESIHKAVAVAAIIARYYFLKEFEKLNEELKIELPKGASAAVDAVAKVIYLKYGEEIFKKIAKLNFKNYQRIK